MTWLLVQTSQLHHIISILTFHIAQSIKFFIVLPERDPRPHRLYANIHCLCGRRTGGLEDWRTDHSAQEDRVQPGWEQSTWQDSVCLGMGSPVAWGRKQGGGWREEGTYQAVKQCKSVTAPATVYCPAPDPLPTGQTTGQGAGRPRGGRPLGLGGGRGSRQY